MKRTTLGLLAALLLAVTAVAGVALTGARTSGSEARADRSERPANDLSVVDSSGARTRLPGLTPASGEPTLPGLAAAAPRRGTVARVAGPFDDRFSWSGLTFDGRRATGALTVTSDVSDLLELQVVAGFYDRAGTLVATRRFVHHASVHDESDAHLPVEREAFSIAVPAGLRSRVVAASVGVPVLVNE